MASTIDTTNWSRLRHASGTCEHVPDALRELSSDDERVRDGAYWKLDNYVVVQGDLYEGAPYVARSLNELLQQSIPSKVRIYDLLIELANGDAPESMLVVIDGQRVPVKQATHDNVVLGLDTYKSDLRGECVEVRRRAAQLLLALSPTADLSVDELRVVLAAESDDEARSLINELIHEVDRAV